tara:strand:- start:8531 stop:9745 length:1215 start_codon:yes stop_codon:yes gene_type:complete
MVTKNFTQFNKTNFEAEGVETCYIVVDYLNDMSGETSDPHGATTTTAGLELVREAIGSRVNILGQTALYDNNSQQAFLVRKDAISSTLLSEIQTDLRSLASDTRTQGLSNFIGYWSQTTAIGESKFRNYKLTFDSAPSDTNNFTVSCWFRATNSDFSEAGSAVYTTYLVSNFVGSGSGGFLVILHGEDAGGGARIQSQIYKGSGSGGVAITAQPANFGSKYLDGNWHHLFTQFRGDSADDAYSVAVNRIYLDGVDVTTSTIPEASVPLPGNAEVSTRTSFMGDGTAARENTVDIADVWVDFGRTTDFRDNISYWYDSGHVDLGTTGTVGGSIQPTIWLHEVDGAVVQGGSRSGTVALEGESSGAVTVYESAGPRGSGLHGNCTVTASDFATKTSDAVTPTNLPD